MWINMTNSVASDLGITVELVRDIILRHHYMKYFYTKKEHARLIKATAVLLKMPHEEVTRIAKKLHVSKGAVVACLLISTTTLTQR